MATKLKIPNLQIETVRKDIKNIHLGVYPPDGRVRVSVPLATNDETLRIFLIKKSDTKQEIKVTKKKSIELTVKPKTTIYQKQVMFEKFYREELEKIIPKLLEKWEKKVGVKVKEVRIKKMKTKWGTCNTKDKRIWLNLELAKQPFHCIDYVFVHELIHFKERKHSQRFLELLENAYPKWRQSKDELNQGILSYFEWGCQSNTKLKNIIEN